MAVKKRGNQILGIRVLCFFDCFVINLSKLSIPVRMKNKFILKRSRKLRTELNFGASFKIRYKKWTGHYCGNVVSIFFDL